MERKAGADDPVVWCSLESGVNPGPAVRLIQQARDDRGDLSFVLTLPKGSPPAATLPEGAVSRPEPSDRHGAVVRFLDETRTGAALFIGSDLPRTAIAVCQARAIPTLMLASFPETGQGIRARLGDLRRRARLRQVDRIIAASSSDATVLYRAGVLPERIEVLGPLGMTGPPPPCDMAEWDHLAGLVSTRPVWLAAGMTGDEVSMVETAYRQTAGVAHRLLLIAMPEDPEGGPDLAARLESAGWRTGLRSRGDDPEDQIQIYIADIPGELGLWCRLAPLTYLGGSFGSKGAVTDPFAPAALGSALIHGPNCGAHAAATQRLRDGDATRPVRASTELGNAVSDLLAPDRAAALAGRAWQVATDGAEVADRVIELLSDAVAGRR